MNAIFLLAPILAIRYGLMALLNRPALRRAAFFPPRAGTEKAAYPLYQLANLFLFAYMFFLEVRPDGPWFIPGLAAYGLGLAVSVWAVVGFAGPGEDGICRRGLYRISRNPMYIGYFLCFLGCAMLARSLALLAALAVFQAAAHWIILSEERWCAREFGETYERYRAEVRRYL